MNVFNDSIRAHISFLIYRDHSQVPKFSENKKSFPMISASFIPTPNLAVLLILYVNMQHLIKKVLGFEA